jgi:cytochrome P450
MSRASIIDIPNLADPRTYADHDMTTVWTTLRSESPVYWNPESSRGPGFWVLTRYADVMAVLRDDKTYVSSKGNVLATLLQGRDPAGGRMLAVMDGESHTELRKLLLRAFSPRVLENMVHRVRQTARRLVITAVERGECDFARDIAAVIPLETICDLLDIPVSDRPHVLKLTKSALSLDQKSHYAEVELAARREILAYFSGLLDERRKHTGTDPISLMIDGMTPGRRLDDIEIILNCYSLIMGGDETARLAMIGAVKALAEDPEQWAVLKDGKASVESATEEVLRWTTPTMHFGRVADADSYLAGQYIPAGDIVTLWLASANRDEQVFPQADKFELGRSPNKHLSLGYGRHFCLGAYLGRVEIAAMLDAMRTLVTRIEQTGPEQRILSNFLSGMSSLPISLEGDLSGVADRQE